MGSTMKSNASGMRGTPKDSMRGAGPFEDKELRM